MWVLFLFYFFLVEQKGEEALSIGIRGDKSIAVTILVILELLWGPGRGTSSSLVCHRSFPLPLILILM